MTDYRIKASKDRTHIELKIEGDFDGRSMMGYLIEAHSLGKKLGINNYLVDVTEARNTDINANNYKFATSGIKQQNGIDNQANVVALINEKDHSHDFVTYALKNMKVFTDPDMVKAYFNKMIS